MVDVDLELAEYRDIKAWLAGKKPPAAGHTWRRRVQVQVHKALPQSVRAVVSTLAPSSFATVIKLVFGFGPGQPGSCRC